MKEGRQKKLKDFARVTSLQERDSQATFENRSRNIRIVFDTRLRIRYTEFERILGDQKAMAWYFFIWHSRQCEL